MSPSATSTVIFAWAALIVLWAAMFIFQRRLRTDLLEFRLAQIFARLHALADSPGALTRTEVCQIAADIQAGLALSEVWSGSLLLVTGSRLRSAAFTSADAAAIRAEIGRVITRHIVFGCPLLWPALLNESWLGRLETKVLTICFAKHSEDLL